jgi:hypothetical protein
VHVPSEAVTTVRPPELLVDTLLLADVPESVCVVVPPTVVEPDTRPPPAVTEELTPDGGRSPGLRCTVLQFSASEGPACALALVPRSDDDELADEDVALCAAACPARATVTAQSDANFIMGCSKSGWPDGMPSGHDCRPLRF